jgi:hypothetical protein
MTLGIWAESLVEPTGTVVRGEDLDVDDIASLTPKPRLDLRHAGSADRSVSITGPHVQFLYSATARGNDLEFIIGCRHANDSDDET